MAILNRTQGEPGDAHGCGRRRRPRIRVLASVIVLGLLPGLERFPAQADLGPADEYKIKAAFLYHFTQLVQWPTNAFASAGAPLNIGVLGNDPFGSELDQTLAEKKVAGRRYVLTRVEQFQDAATCHLLFVSDSESRRLTDILEGLSGQPVLTVGESDGFAAQGGVIGMVKGAEKIQLEINPAAANQAGLWISSRLLRLARLVPGRGDANADSPGKAQQEETGP